MYTLKHIAVELPAMGILSSPSILPLSKTSYNFLRLWTTGIIIDLSFLDSTQP